MVRESALCLCAYHRYWQGGTVAECRAQALCPRRLIVRPGIEGAAKEKWLYPSFYFPPLRSPPGLHTTQCGWQWMEGEKELEGQRDFKIATKMTASCHLLPQVNVPVGGQRNWYRVECTTMWIRAFCPLSLQDIVISILSQLSPIQCEKSGTVIDHDVRWLREFWPSPLSENKQVSQYSSILGEAVFNSWIQPAASPQWILTL